jgi:hypothetical protein
MYWRYHMGFFYDLTYNLTRPDVKYPMWRENKTRAFKNFYFFHSLRNWGKSEPIITYKALDNFYYGERKLKYVVDPMKFYSPPYPGKFSKIKNYVYSEPTRIVMPQRFSLWQYARNSSARNFPFLRFDYHKPYLTQANVKYMKSNKGFYSLKDQKLPIKYSRYRKNFKHYTYHMNKNLFITQRKFHHNLDYTVVNTISFGRYDPWNLWSSNTYTDYFMLNSYGYSISHNILLKIFNNFNQIFLMDFSTRLSALSLNMFAYLAYYFPSLPDPWPFFGFF